MSIKTVAVSGYLLAMYWLSQHLSIQEMLFYPTLGAFSYYFMCRSMRLKDSLLILFGAVLAAEAGSLLHHYVPGIMAFFLICLLTIGALKVAKMNAAPIAAIAIIPYFTDLSSVWVLPVSVFITLAGLIAVLFAAHALEAVWQGLLQKMKLTASSEDKVMEM
jgi:hypothetical protein